MKAITQINQTQGTSIGALCDALGIPRATYYWHQVNGKNQAQELIQHIPKNALSAAEKNHC
jgi:uncharacterized protein HemX